MLKEKLAQVPNLPGSYQMKNKHGVIIYVGKAKNLADRVKQYFQDSNLYSRGWKLPSLLPLIWKNRLRHHGFGTRRAGAGRKTHQKIPALFQFPGQRRQALPVFKTVHVGRFPAPVRRAQKIAGQRPIFRSLSQIQHGTQPDALFMEKQVRPAAAVQVEFFAGKTPGRAENKFLPVFSHRPVPRAVRGQNCL